MSSCRNSAAPALGKNRPKRYAFRSQGAVHVGHNTDDRRFFFLLRRGIRDEGVPSLFPSEPFTKPPYTTPEGSCSAKSATCSTHRSSSADLPHSRGLPFLVVQTMSATTELEYPFVDVPLATPPRTGRRAQLPGVLSRTRARMSPDRRRGVHRGGGRRRHVRTGVIHANTPRSRETHRIAGPGQRAIDRIFRMLWLGIIARAPNPRRTIAATSRRGRRRCQEKKNKSGGKAPHSKAAAGAGHFCLPLGRAIAYSAVPSQRT